MKNRKKEIILLIIITHAGLLLRLFQGFSLFHDGQFFYPADDPPYHFRRLLMLLTGQGDPSGIDPFVSFGHDSIPCWQTGFDYLIYILIYPFTGSSPDKHQIMIASSWIIPFLGASVIPVTYFAARKIFSVKTAIISAAVLAILPAHHDYSFFGRVDHHVLEPLFAILTVLFIFRRKQCFYSFLAGSVTGFSMLFWQSALPFLLFSSIVTNLILLHENTGKKILISYNSSLLGSAFLSILLSPYSADIVFYSASLMHLILVFDICFSIFLIMFFINNFSPVKILLIYAASSILLFIFSLVFIPGFSRSFIDGLAYFGTSGIGKIVWESATFPSDPVRFFLLATYLLPLSLVPLFRDDFWKRKKTEDGDLKTSFAPENITAVYFIFSLCMAMVQRRFLVFASPFIAIFVARGLLDTFEVMKKRFLFGMRSTALVISVLVAVSFALYPSIRHDLTFKPLDRKDISIIKTARFLSDYSKEKNLDPAKSAVLVNWGYGHVFEFEAGLPSVCDNFFGPPENDSAFMDCLRYYYSPDADKTIRELFDKGVRFIILFPPDPYQVKLEAETLDIDPDYFVTMNEKFTVYFSETFMIKLAANAGLIQDLPSGEMRSIRLIHTEENILLFEITGSG